MIAPPDWTARRVSLWIGCALALVLAGVPRPAHSDTVASLLGNFTINQYCGLQLTPESVQLHYAVVFGQLPAMRELYLADTNRDGVTSQAERDAYVERLAPQLARGLPVKMDGKALQLRLIRWTSSLPVEQGGFSLRLDAEFSAPLPSPLSPGAHTLQLANGNYGGRLGWHEITVQAAPSVHVYDTDGFSTSLTAGLTQALRSLPASGPLDERAVTMSFSLSPPPPGARPLQPRSAALASTTTVTSPPGAGNGTVWLQEQTHRLVGLISAPHLQARIVILSLLFALALGSLHALSPGHGKTIVGAYLIGSRGTPRHALFLGLTVTVTHTLGVFALGFATLFASRFIVPETLFPILSLISGFLVFGMGVVLLAQRWHNARRAMAFTPGTPYRHDHHHAAMLHQGASWALADPVGHSHGAATHSHDHFHTHAHDHGAHTHDHGEGHGHDHVHGDPHPEWDHGHEALVHSHGGTTHSHLPPGADGAKITWRSLLALGISGGLVPCPSAMVLLLAAVALNKTAYGLLLVVAFSIGLAVSLTVIGVAFLYARDRFRLRNAGSRWKQLLPVASAAVITVIGAFLCLTALQSTRL